MIFVGYESVKSNILKESQSDTLQGRIDSFYLNGFALQIPTETQLIYLVKKALTSSYIKLSRPALNKRHA